MNKLIIFDFSNTLVEIETGKSLISAAKLKELIGKGYMLSLFSGAKREEIGNYLQREYSELFAVVVAMEDVTMTKPSDEGIKKIINEVRPDEVIYVGDSENDFIAAKSAGVGFLTPDLIYLL